ncbi:MAG: HD domain-containing protein [Magnetococcales bacterium]|nr:HD domain-containing protein [Magnetococcales bacterium]
MIEARSGETGHHVRRVAESSRLMARLLGLSAHETDVLWMASPMHDLGKIGISDHILNKPGKLNDEEWKSIKNHPEIGYRVLQGQEREVVKAGAVISIQHHEKWNGTGYPEGLKGEEIHLFARITAVIDVVDALYHARAYKPAWPMEKIIALLQEERGRHFEPRLVDLFLDHLDDFLLIQTKYAG